METFLLSVLLLVHHIHTNMVFLFRREWREALQAIINDVSGFAMKRSYICHSYSDSLALLKTFVCSVCLSVYCNTWKIKVVRQFTFTLQWNHLSHLISFLIFVSLYRNGFRRPSDNQLFCHSQSFNWSTEKSKFDCCTKILSLNILFFLYRLKWFSTLFGCRPRLSYNITYEEKHSSKLFNMIFRYKKRTEWL